jgi:hypothetical protein
MGLKTMSLSDSATGISVTGGTALPFSDDGVTVPNGVHLVCTGDTDFATRRTITAKVRPSSLDPKTGVYGKDKKSLCLALPIVATDGSVKFATIRIEREVVPAMTAAQCTNLNRLGAQLLVDADTDNFWANGGLS